MIIEEAMTPPSPREELPLKLPDLIISPGDPWNDDVLGRRDLATRLTKLIQCQKAPFVISIDGNWGTGKTFFLQRWKKDLEKQCYSAIYFNAWEDDFCDDPLLAIIGQLYEYFEARKSDKIGELAHKLISVTRPLLHQIPLAILQGYTGIPLKFDTKSQSRRNLLQEYLDQRTAKDRLKQHLVKMAATIYEETGHPLVFIIDELDRCRPTFAIELLERVKHIFDVPNLVFIFGINRDELCSALQSVYGEIDVAVYLRRFFDMEFMLPETDSVDFCKALLDRFELSGHFVGLSERVNSNVHISEFNDLAKWVPMFWTGFGMSLRDLDYCVRMVALVCRNLEPKKHMYPLLLIVLIPLKLRNPNLYRQLIQGDCHASDVLNYVHETFAQKDRSPTAAHPKDIEHILDCIEVQLYRAESQRDSDSESPAILNQLRLLHEGADSKNLTLLSEKTKQTDKERIEKLLKLSSSEAMPGYRGNMIDDVAKMIDLHQSIVRR